VLRTLLGNRPAILIPLALYLLTTLNFSNYSWWITAVEAIPLQIALFMALDEHVRYVWTRQMRHAYAAAGWLLFGLLFYEKAVIIPLVLFAVTAGFLVGRRRLRTAVRDSVVELWRAWTLYLGLMVAYVAVFFVVLSTSTTQPQAPASMHAVLVYVWDMIFRTLVPGFLGGPWRWLHPAGSAGAYSWPPDGLAWVALVIVLGVIVASMLTRRRAWRAWVILPGWLLLADVLPTAIGRLIKPGWAGILATEPRYVADAAAILTIVMALVFWPICAPRADAGHIPQRRDLFTGQWRKVAGVLVAVIAIGSVWSVAKFSAGTTDATGPYLANVTKALAVVPDGTVIVNRGVPSQIMIAAFEQSAEESTVLGPLVSRGKHVTWTAQPTGNLGNVMIFGPDGRLYVAAIGGVTSPHVGTFQDCLTPTRTRLVVQLPTRAGLGPYVHVLRIGYLANAGYTGTRVTVNYNGISRTLQVLSGAHNAYLAVTGSASTITMQAQGDAGAFCFEKAVAGYFVPLPRSGIPRAAG
jgi:hypothetical protein